MLKHKSRMLLKSRERLATAREDDVSFAEIEAQTPLKNELAYQASPLKNQRLVASPPVMRSETS